MFPHLLERTRLFRKFNVHRVEADEFLASPSLIGVIDSYGIELLHPRREGRSESQIGKKGFSNRRWIVGGKLCFVLDHLGQIVDWDCDTANVHDGSVFQYLVDKFRNDIEGGISPSRTTSPIFRLFCLRPGSHSEKFGF